VTLASPDDARGCGCDLADAVGAVDVAGAVGSPRGAGDSLDGDMAAELRIETLSDRRGIRLVGDVDVFTRYELETALRTLADRGGDVRIDLARLTFIDTGGVRQLIDMANRLAPGRRLVLHNAPYELRRVVELLWRRPPAGMELDGS
jgi:anti-anti-sigma regulatory factor